eukprot:jgi/Tetstr1/427712/TSEL_017837.t1
MPSRCTALRSHAPAQMQPRRALAVRSSMAPIGRNKSRGASEQQPPAPRRSAPPTTTRRRSARSQEPFSMPPFFQPASPRELFFFGRALVETINDRVASAALDMLSEVSKASAELPTSFVEFQDEVYARAEAEMSKSKTSSASAQGSGAASSPAPDSGASQPVVDVQDIVDDLRAELAAARAAAQAVKVKSIGAAAPLNGASQ